MIIDFSTYSLKCNFILSNFLCFIFFASQHYHNIHFLSKFSYTFTQIVTYYSPTLYVGEHEHGLYAIPSLVDEKTVTIAVS